MPHNFPELEHLLASTSAENRDKLALITGAPFGPSPAHICDHMNYLRSNALGQFFSRRNYKQLVTDVADKVEINWQVLLGRRTWHELSPTEIEAAILTRVEEVGNQAKQEDDVPFADEVAAVLTVLIVLGVPVVKPAGFVVQKSLSRALRSLNTNWRSLTAAILFIHTAVRKT